MEKIPLESITLFPHTFTTWASAELAIFLAMVQEPPPGTCLHFAIRWTNGSVYTGDIPFSLDEAGGVSSRPLASYVILTLEELAGRRLTCRALGDKGRERASFLLDRHEIEGGRVAPAPLDWLDGLTDTRGRQLQRGVRCL